MQFFQLFKFLTLLTAVKAAITISKDTVTNGVVQLSVGDITIEPSVFWSIIDNAVSTFTGSINIGSGGGFYISSSNPVITLAVTSNGKIPSIINDGTLAVLSKNASTFPTFGFLCDLFQNSGNLFFGAINKEVYSTGYRVLEIVSPNWSNTGTMSFYQTTKTNNIVLLGSMTGSLINNEINNEGNICFYNFDYFQSSSIAGTGCIHIQGTSTAYMYSPEFAISTSQVFYLENSQSSFIVHTYGVTTITSTPFTIAGFGNFNRIGLDSTISSISYDPSTGILKVFFSTTPSLAVNFNIGLGYDDTLFDIISYAYPGISFESQNTVIYKGSVPNSAPAICKACPEIPVPPTSAGCSVCTTYTTTITTTDSNGKPTTETGLVIIGTTTGGSTYTTTIQPTPCNVCTTYTTTITTTDSNGKPTTETGVVIIGTTTGGSTYTTTSIIQPTPCNVCTAYTTTITTTDSNGKPTTETGVVIIGTTTGGLPVTTTSIIQPTPCNVCTTYTTTTKTTDSNGNPTTVTGVVCVCTNSGGVPYTSTSAKGGNPTHCPICSTYTTSLTISYEHGIPIAQNCVVIVTTTAGVPYTTTMLIQEVPGVPGAGSPPAGSLAGSPAGSGVPLAGGSAGSAGSGVPAEVIAGAPGSSHGLNTFSATISQSTTNAPVVSINPNDAMGLSPNLILLTFMSIILYVIC